MKILAMGTKTSKYHQAEKLASLSLFIPIQAAIHFKIITEMTTIPPAKRLVSAGLLFTGISIGSEKLVK